MQTCKAYADKYICDLAIVKFIAIDNPTKQKSCKNMQLYNHTACKSEKEKKCTRKQTMRNAVGMQQILGNLHFTFEDRLINGVLNCNFLI